MNFSRAFSYVFDDRDWVAKLGVTFAITIISVPLTLILVGLAGWSVILGYQCDLVRNWRGGASHPLPRWDDLGGYLNRGVNILAALIVYNLPNVLIGCCVYTLLPSMGSTFTGTGITLALACCVLPFVLVYNLLTWPMLALGLARYGDEQRIGVYFEFRRLLALVREHVDISIQYLLSSLLANIIFALFLIIPCVGWVAMPALAMPVQGALTGQYASRVLGKPRQRPQTPPPAPYRRR